MTIKNKHLILVPRLNNPGGIANYYTALRNYLDKNVIYFYRGKSNKEVFLKRIIQDYRQYIQIINSDVAIKTVLINSSFGKGGFNRDALFILLTPKKKKRIVFFRGWNTEFEQRIEKSIILKKIFQNTFLKADLIIVLSSEFKQKLIKWGYQGKILVETTVVDEFLINDIHIKDLLKLRNNKPTPNVLYLGYLNKEKGLLEVVDSIDHYSTLYPDRKLTATIAGSGSLLKELMSNVDKRGLPIHFPGYVQKEKKAEAFKNAVIYLFPSIHGEGMPNSVLEAMAFGLPILTTRVGGIPDFFEEGKMGLFLENREPEYIAERIEYLLKRPELMREMSEYNYYYAKEHFYASKVANRLESIIDEVVQK